MSLHHYTKGGVGLLPAGARVVVLDTSCADSAAARAQVSPHRRVGVQAQTISFKLKELYALTGSRVESMSLSS